MAKTSLKIPAKTETNAAEATPEEVLSSSQTNETEVPTSSGTLQFPTSGGAFQLDENGNLVKGE
ncbi:hypothetical protein EVB27_149 [Rhizobium phage RHph_TM16]|nr:hypothetical protein EVB27_149 [Rhizobium phage RHph_TM16]